MQPHLQYRLGPPPGPTLLGPFKYPVLWGTLQWLLQPLFGWQQASPEPVHPEILSAHGFTHNPTLLVSPVCVHLFALKHLLALTSCLSISLITRWAWSGSTGSRWSCCWSGTTRSCSRSAASKPCRCSTTSKRSSRWHFCWLSTNFKWTIWNLQLNGIVKYLSLP